MSLITRILARYIITLGALLLLQMMLPGSLAIGGGAVGAVIVAAVVTGLNVLVRPVLNVFLLPLKLLGGLLIVVLANVVFLKLAERIVDGFPPHVATLDVRGFVATAFIAVVLGAVNYVTK